MTRSVLKLLRNVLKKINNNYMSLKDTLLSLAVTIALVLGVVSFLSSSGTPNVNLSASAGPDHTERQFFLAGVVDGGSRKAIDPIDSTYTLTAADLKDAKIITFVASTTQPALTLTTAASTTLASLAPRVGDTFSFIVENPFTAAATTTTIAAGTGVDLQEPDGQNVVIGINNYAYIKCTNGLDSGAPRDFVCTVDETIPAD